MNDWISVEQKTPLVDGPFLVFDPEEGILIGWWEQVRVAEDALEWCWTGDTGFDINPTHWMVLPDEPDISHENRPIAGKEKEQNG